MNRPKSKVANVRVRGPLAPFLPELWVRLRVAGYTPLSAVNQLRLAAHLSRWLGANQLGVTDLTEDRIADFFSARRSAGYTGLLSPLSLAPLLDVLAAQRALPLATTVPAIDPDAGSVIAAFTRYLVEERGLSASTVGAYTLRAARFLTSVANRELGMLTARDVTGAVLAESHRVSVGSTQYFVAALRSFLRFCRAEGLIEVDLSGASLAITGRRQSRLPQGISRPDAAALLRTCDRREAIGRRDYAVLMTLLRLGLRASEVAALSLDDVDWRAAEIVVHGKGRRDERLPLPADVGKAIADYLRRGRPGTTRREVFLRAIAPIGDLGRGGVSYVVRRACRRAGLTPFGAHRLRHTLACEMVGAGVPLHEIGQVLRHRDVSSTAIYARVGVDQLRSLALPWPGESAR